jgi:predicted transposase YdaD
MTLQMKFDEKFEEGLERGIVQGITQGIEQGRQKENRQIIQNMLNNNLSPEMISKYTNHSLDYIHQIQEELKTADACVVQEDVLYGK